MPTSHKECHDKFGILDIAYNQGVGGEVKREDANLSLIVQNAPKDAKNRKNAALF